MFRAHSAFSSGGIFLFFAIVVWIKVAHHHLDVGALDLAGHTESVPSRRARRKVSV